jgi:hypothetical protein
MSSTRTNLLLAALTLGAMACSEAEPAAPGPLVATNEPGKSGAWTSLEPRIEGDVLLVDVVAHGVPELSGIALRIDHPTWAKLDKRDIGPGWDPSALHLTKSVGAHEVSLVDTVKGETAGLAVGERKVLSTVRFRIEGAPASGDLGALKVVPIRSELRDGAGRVVESGYAGATFAR